MKLRLDIDASTWLLLALLCLTVPVNWLLAALLAALVHEGCHVVAVYFAGGRIHGVRVGPQGTVLESTPLEPIVELLCILAGPMGSIALVLCSRFLPRIAVCALIQGLFNLLPVEPLDGGRALRCICGFLIKEAWTDSVCLWTGRIVGLLLLCTLYWVGICNHLGFSVFIPGLLILRMTMGRKIPCKQT